MAYIYGDTCELISGKQSKLNGFEDVSSAILAGSIYLHYADYIAGNGVALYEMAVKNDLEGIVAKPRDSRYGPGTVWYKIKAPHYSQAARPAELVRQLQKN